MHPSRVLGLLILMALIGASCGEIVEPEAFNIPSTTAPPQADSGASSVEPPNAVNPPVTLISPNFVPQRPIGYLPEVLISTDFDILSSGATGQALSLAGVFADLGSVRAVDDMLGGLVFQRPGASGEVIWLSGEGAAATVVAESSTLLDVGFSGSAFAVVQADEVIDLVRLADLVRTPLLTLAEGEEVLALSASGGLNAIVLADDACGELRLYDMEGSQISFERPGNAVCPVPRRPYFATVALSPDGAALAYTVVTYRDDGLESETELVASDLASGRVYFRGKIGEDGDRITDLTFDGDRVAYLRTRAQVFAVTVLEVVLGAQEQTVILDPALVRVNSISFARLPLAEG